MISKMFFDTVSDGVYSALLSTNLARNGSLGADMRKSALDQDVSTLMDAAETGDLETINSLFALECVRERISVADGAFMLARAIGSYHLNVVKRLVELAVEKGDERMLISLYNGALSQAIEYGQVDVIYCLLEREIVRNFSTTQELIRSLSNPQQLNLLNFALENSNGAVFSFVWNNSSEDLKAAQIATRKMRAIYFIDVALHQLDSKQFRDIEQYRHKKHQLEMIREFINQPQQGPDYAYCANYIGYIFSNYIMNYNSDFQDIRHIHSALIKLSIVDIKEVSIGITVLKERNKITEANILAIIDAAGEKEDDPKAILDTINQIANGDVSQQRRLSA